MSDASLKTRSPLGGARSTGTASVEEIGPLGMITLRGDLSSAALAAAVKAATGTAMPGQRRIETADGKSAGWMSPDELLLILPYADAPAAVAALDNALAGEHHLAVDVSDARAVFRISGPGAREALAKLSPTDLSPAAFGAGELRRSRAAQVSAAFWMDAEGVFTLVCFRSVAAYVFGLLSGAAAPGSEVGLW